jgi:hypothetical protein
MLTNLTNYNMSYIYIYIYIYRAQDSEVNETNGKCNTQQQLQIGLLCVHLVYSLWTCLETMKGKKIILRTVSL